MALWRFITGSRQFRLRRIVGPRTVIQIAIWSIVATIAFTVYRTPSILEADRTVDAFVAALPLAMVPLVVGGVGVIIIVVSVLQEIRYVLFGRRRGGSTRGMNDLPSGGGWGGVGGFGGDGGDDDDE